MSTAAVAAAAAEAGAVLRILTSDGVFGGRITGVSTAEDGEAVEEGMGGIAGGDAAAPAAAVAVVAGFVVAVEAGAVAGEVAEAGSRRLTNRLRSRN